jgi:hypothetical protein
VTRLGEYSPNWEVFTLDSLLKITEMAHILGLLFHTVRVLHKIYKKWVGLYFGLLYKHHLVTLFALILRSFKDELFFKFLPQRNPLNLAN